MAKKKMGFIELFFMDFVLQVRQSQREEIPCLRLSRLQAKLGSPNDVPETRGKMRCGISSQCRDFVVCKTTKEKGFAASRLLLFVKNNKRKKNAARQNGVMNVVRAKGFICVKAKPLRGCFASLNPDASTARLSA